MSKASSSEISWVYSIARFASLALVVLTACHGIAGSFTCNLDELCVDTYPLASGILVPECSLRKTSPIEIGCDEEHYHGEYSGFVESDMGYAFVMREDPAPVDCGQGKKRIVRKSLEEIQISQENLVDYMAAVGSVCWSNL